MTRYAILVSSSAEGWAGPDLLPWEPGLVGGGCLALRVRGDNGRGRAVREWMACELGWVESIRYCELHDRSARPCLQVEMTIRRVGAVSAFTSVPCLRYLEKRGIPIAAMEEPDSGACHTRWSELREGSGDLSGKVCDLVNVAAVWSVTGSVSAVH